MSVGLSGICCVHCTALAIGCIQQVVVGHTGKKVLLDMCSGVGVATVTLYCAVQHAAELAIPVRTVYQYAVGDRGG
jgi:hypothetical protein